MARQIKFRGLRTDGKGWVYGFFVQLPDGKCRIYWQPFTEASNNTWHEVTPESVGQFTGLLDKNGKEIYEGDKLEIMGGLNYNVVFDYFQFCVSNGRTMYGFNQVKSEQTLVIGNIHESEVSHA